MTISQITGAHGGIVLTSAVYSNPVTVTATGTVLNANGYGISAATSWQIDNLGSVGGSYGVYLGAGGAVTNAAGGQISGHYAGIFAQQGQAGTVNNAGSVAAAEYGVKLKAGGSSITNAATGLITSITEQAVILLKVGKVDNSGSIGSSDQVGVELDAAGSVINRTGGVITGSGRAAVWIAGAGAVANSGSISGNGNAGIYLSGAGSITDAAGGSITGTIEGVKAAGSASVQNAGVISGTSANAVGVYLGSAGEMLTNAASGSIVGGRDGVLLASGTVQNAGAISGGVYAIDFAQGGANRLIDAAGAVFKGNVAANSGGTNTLELSAQNGPGALTGLGSQFRGFQTIAIDHGASWEVKGAKAGFKGEVIGGFTASDLIDETDLSYAAGETATLVTGNVLDIMLKAKVIATLQLSPADTLAGDNFAVFADGAGGTDIAIASPTTALWVAPAGGAWNTAEDWSNAAIPAGATADVTISLAAAAPYTVGFAPGLTGTLRTLTVASAGATFLLQGSLTASRGLNLYSGLVALAGGTLTGAAWVAAGAKIAGQGVINGAVSGGGVVDASGGVLKITGSVTGAGTLMIENAATLEVGRGVSGGIDFAAAATPAETLILDVPGSAIGTITGFAAGDTIDLKGLAATGDTYAGGVLTVLNGAKAVATLTIAGSFPGMHFQPSGDGQGGTEITLQPGAAHNPDASHAAVGSLADRQLAQLIQAVTAYAGSSSATGDRDMSPVRELALDGVAAPFAHRIQA